MAGWYRYKCSENLENFVKATGMPMTMVEAVKTHKLGMKKNGDTWTMTESFSGAVAVNKFKFDEEFKYKFPGESKILLPNHTDTPAYS